MNDRLAEIQNLQAHLYKGHLELTAPSPLVTNTQTHYDAGVVRVHSSHGEPIPVPSAIAAFIAAAPEAIDWLISEVERLRGVTPLES